MKNLTIYILACSVVAAVQAEPLDEALPNYQPVSGVSGGISSAGSDTLNNLMTLWSEGFRKVYPNVTISIEGKGSATAPPALMEGTAQFGPMSRPMKSEEIDAFEKKFGYKPTEVKLAIDALAVFAHKDNPIKGLSLKQLDGVFSKTRKRGSANLLEWGQLGVDGWRGRPISLYGRNSASGTYGFFQKHVLQRGDYKVNVKEQLGSSAVVQGVGGDFYSLGYSGIGYKTSGVRLLPLSEDGGDLVEATYENALNGEYPLARFLMIYVNKKPGEPLATAPLEFLKFALSNEGQTIVHRDGYFPLPAGFVAEIIKSLSE